MNFRIVSVLCLATAVVGRQEHGYIFLHGLGGGGGALGCAFMQAGLGLSSDDVRLECPEAECNAHTLLPPTWVEYFYPDSNIACVPSWFNFNLMPTLAVVSTSPGSDQEQLRGAANIVEELIEDMIADGIPSENIVLSGASQGGALTLYEAAHSKYKLGAFIPIVTWFPNLVVDPPTISDTVNADTPILHMNGAADPIVTLVAGYATEDVMRTVFSDYELKNIPLTTHTTTINPPTFLIMRQWLLDHNLLGIECLVPLPLTGCALTG